MAELRASPRLPCWHDGTLALVKQKVRWVQLRGEPSVPGLSSLEDEQRNYGADQDQECNKLGDTHVAP